MASVRDAVRVFNKHALNPVMMRMAGRKHWYAGVIRHTGRRTGQEYATPVVADRVADGFIVPLPHGTGVDWLRNVLAAPQLAPKRRRAFQRFGIDRYMKVQLAHSGE